MKAFASTVIVLSFVAAAVDILSPAGPYSKYIRTVIGVVLIVAILNPVLSVLSKNFTLEDYIVYQGDQADYSAAFSKKVQQQFEKQLVNKLKEYYPDTDFHCTFTLKQENGGFAIDQVILKTPAHFAQMKETLVREFGISPQNITAE